MQTFKEGAMSEIDLLLWPLLGLPEPQSCFVNMVEMRCMATEVWRKRTSLNKAKIILTLVKFNKTRHYAC